ncbi:NAD(P)-binding protein [Sarocladium strictum]
MAMASYAILPLAVIGGLVVCKAIHTAYLFLTFHFLTPSQPLKAYKSPGTESHALITGASGGIGLGIAQELAHQGFGVILLGHISEELWEAAEDIRRQCPGAIVRTITMNAMTATESKMRKVVDALSDIRISILVNNVGGNAIASPDFRHFNTYTFSDIDNVMNHNDRFMARLTMLLLPHLQQKPTPSSKSLILTMASGGMIGLPSLVMYSATKAFNHSFSIALARDLESDPETSHIDSLCVLPGDVHSQGNTQGLVPGTPKWDFYGRMIVRRADKAVERKMRVMTPWWKHAAQIAMLNFVPEGMLMKELNKVVEVKIKAWEEIYAKSK